MKHTLNFNPICNTVDTNNKAADTMRTLIIGVTRIKRQLESGLITRENYNHRLANLLEKRLSDFDAVRRTT